MVLSLPPSNPAIPTVGALCLISFLNTSYAIIMGTTFTLSLCVGVKAVDCLMNSKWTNEPRDSKSDQPHFVNRTFAVDYCNKSVTAAALCRHA